MTTWHRLHPFLAYVRDCWGLVRAGCTMWRRYFDGPPDSRLKESTTLPSVVMAVPVSELP